MAGGCARCWLAAAAVGMVAAAGAAGESQRHLQSGGGATGTATLLSDMTLWWQLDDAVNPTAVDFRVQAQGNVWIGFARSDAFAMLNSGVTGVPGSGPAVIGMVSSGSVAQYVLGGYNVGAITQTATSTLTGASVAFNATTSTTTLRFRRPLAATGHATEKAIDPRTAQRFVFAHGESAGFAFHGSNYGSALLTLAPGLCTRSAVCGNRGACASPSGSTCVCDVGYTGATCGSCGVGFASSGGACTAATSGVVAEGMTAATTLTLNASFAAVAGMPGSATRATFLTTLTTQVAAALDVSRARLNVTDVREGSVIVDLAILPPAAAIGAPDLAGRTNPPAGAVAVTLQSQAASPTSALRSSGVAAALVLPANGQLPVSLNLPATFTATAQLSSTLQLQWFVSGGAVTMRATSSAGAGTWFAIGFNGAASMVGGDVVAYVPGAGSTAATQVRTCAEVGRRRLGDPTQPP